LALMQHMTSPFVCCSSVHCWALKHTYNPPIGWLRGVSGSVARAKASEINLHCSSTAVQASSSNPGPMLQDMSQQLMVYHTSAKHDCSDILLRGSLRPGTAWCMQSRYVHAAVCCRNGTGRHNTSIRCQWIKFNEHRLPSVA
jgi:hypothetical protein